MSRFKLQDTSSPPDVAALNTEIVFLLLGIYGWEYFQSLHIEWALVCGRLAFRSSLIPYVLGRVSLLIFLILYAVATSPYPGGINCPPGVFTIAVLGNITLGSSSMNFLIRTWVRWIVWAVWKDSRLVHALLVLLALGQWTLLAIEVATISSIIINGVDQVYLRLPQVNAATNIYTWIVYIPPVVAALLGDLFVCVLVSNIGMYDDKLDAHELTPSHAYEQQDDGGRHRLDHPHWDAANNGSRGHPEQTQCQ
ncbi:hypothetical protein OG21DRAFT_1521937 [Imleria badia]|nr:hypothetical protein OG21DRAFT_1521937 [Imleria badia]